MLSGSQAVSGVNIPRMQAGEDLEEDEDEEKEEDEEQIAGTSSLTPAPLRPPEMFESTPLLQTTSSKSRSRSRRRRMSVGPHGDATVMQAVLMVRSLEGVDTPLLIACPLAFKILHRHRRSIPGSGVRSKVLPF